MRLFKLKDADVWQKGTYQELMDLALRMINEGKNKQVMSHYNKGISSENQKKSRRQVELSRDDVWTLIRKIADPKKKAAFIAAGAYLADSEPYNGYSPKTQAQYYLQELEFADFVIEQIPDENLRADICLHLPTGYDIYDRWGIPNEAITIARYLYESIESKELLEELNRHKQFENWKKTGAREATLRIYGGKK